MAGNCASNPERFQCSAEECIFTKFVCDGTADCENGEDEANCLDYMSLFKKEAGFKTQIARLNKKVSAASDKARDLQNELNQSQNSAINEYGNLETS